MIINRDAIACELHLYSYPGSSHDGTGLTSVILTVNVQAMNMSFSRQIVGEKGSSSNENLNSTDNRQILQVLTQEVKSVF